jgi:hypothetical protein
MRMAPGRISIEDGGASTGAVFVSWGPTDGGVDVRWRWVERPLEDGEREMTLEEGRGLVLEPAEPWSRMSVAEDAATLSVVRRSNRRLHVIVTPLLAGPAFRAEAMIWCLEDDNG